MAYKYKTVTVADPTLFLQELRDFLVDDCGWTDETPSGQDDEMGANDYHGILGYFLKSTGEDSDTDVRAHLFTAQKTDFANNRWNNMVFPAVSYLSAALSDSGTSVSVDDGTPFSAITTPFPTRVGDEIVTISGVSGNTLTISARGVAGTTAAAHSVDDPIVATQAAACAEVYAYRDLSTPIKSSTSQATMSVSSVASVGGLSGFGDDRFNLHTFIRVSSGVHDGKMRPITDYSSTNGDFTYVPFKDAPGTVDIDLVSMGFLPTASRRMVTGSYHLWPRVEMAEPGADTVFWFYGSKDSFMVVSKYDSGYDTFHAGNVVPYSARDTAVTTADVSAGATSFDVDDRTLFAVGEKFRIISQNVADWAANESRTSPEVDLDPEEIPTEEVVVQSITAGTGNAGTITINSTLQFSYKSGAVVGEDPRPSGASSNSYTRVSGAGLDVMDGAHCWLPVYMVVDKADIANHMSHRQTWRAVHSNSNKNSPYEIYLGSQGRHESSRDLNVGGGMSSGNVAYDTVQNGRPVFGLYSIRLTSSNYGQYGVYQVAKGVLSNIWWSAVDSYLPPFSAVEEDTYKARWGTTYEEFRLFKQRSSSNAYAVLGPEIS